jgi:outer membrane receptor protein involved in Fe transport
VLTAILTSFAGTAAAQDSGASSKNTAVLEEIIVTATRREASLQDISLSVSAITGSELERMGADNLQDYYRVVPNLAVVDRGPGGRQYSIRGVSAGIVQQGAATVGVYIDEMPVTANGFQPDLSVYDLDRIEILRGPQGTLFGEGSLGGTVRMITPTPDTESFGADVSVDYSSTDEGGNNSAVNGMVNFALSENTALRLTGYYRDIDGYITRVANPAGIQLDVGALVGAPGAFPPILDTGPIPERNDINSEETTGGRASFLWNATDNLTLKVNYLKQESEFGGRNTEIQSLGDLETNFFLAEKVDDDLDLANLTITYDFGWATLLSSTSAYERDRTQLSDNADLGEQVFPGLNLAGVGTLTQEFQDQVSQELRLTSQGDGRINWTAGFFYIDKEDGFEQIIVDEEDFFITFVNVFFEDVLGGTVIPSPPLPITSGRQLLDLSGRFDETQYAVYGEVDFQFSEAWSGTVGLRYYDYDKTDTIVNNDLNLLGFGLQDGVYEADDSGTNVKLGVNYKPNDDLLFYVTASEGFRIGGTNTAPGIPPENITYGPDSLWNYELGAKTTFADGRVRLNSAIYYVDWSDIQLALPLGFSFGTINAGQAEVIGAEIEVLVKAGENLDFSLALGLNKGELTEDAPGANDPGNPNPGFKGDRLPGTPDVNAAASAQYNFPIGGLDSFVRLDYTYTGDMTTTFNELSVGGSGESSHFELDAYSLLNLRFGIGGEHWTSTLYVDNATDERADILIDNAAIATRVTRNRPRTIGLKLQYNY